LVEVIWIPSPRACGSTWGRAAVDNVTSYCVQVDGSMLAGYASISVVNLKIWVDERVVRSESQLGGVGNLERAN
jgi:hypothetical protein